MTLVSLRNYDNSWYNPGRSFLWRTLWMFLGLPLFQARWLPSSALRVQILRVFGAQVGLRNVIRNHVAVKYPWHLSIGDDCWIGEQVWIDNLCSVRIGSNTCLSQGAYLCTGNHDWSDPSFGLRIAPIEISDSAWVGARSILMPGVFLGPGAVAAAGSVVTKPVGAFEIVAGNPAAIVKTRVIRAGESIKSTSSAAPEPLETLEAQAR